jgi:hypothetical protein
LQSFYAPQQKQKTENRKQKMECSIIHCPIYGDTAERMIFLTRKQISEKSPNSLLCIPQHPLFFLFVKFLCTTGNRKQKT